MGTSSAYGGPGGGTPLVPSWMQEEGDLQNGPANGTMPGGATPQNGIPPPAVPPAPANQPLPLPAKVDRFTGARNNFSRFASSGGRDRANLGRSVSNYASSSAGGSRQATLRMG